MINQQLIDGVFNKDKRSIARVITLIENGDPESLSYLKILYSKTGNAYKVGITGPPGAGKSTITNQLAKKYLKESKSVAIIAVDPTSPFTGGAVLGDRVRMNDIGISDSVYIRSMATRGSLGGLSSKAIDCADILDASGFDIIIFETVGVGQSELDIVNAADTTIVTLVPESGDSVQAMKAGLMEIADIYVVNKFDRPDGVKVITAIQSILSLKNIINEEWTPPILQTIATEDSGIEEVHQAIEDHGNINYSKNFKNSKRFDNTVLRIRGIVNNAISQRIWDDSNSRKFDKFLEAVSDKKISPYELAEKFIADINL